MRFLEKVPADAIQKHKKIYPFKACAVFFTCIVVSWLPYLLSFAPGSVLGDSISSISQVLSGNYNNHHPFFYTLFVGLFIRIGTILGNINIGIFLYTLTQYLILAASLTYVLYFMYMNGLRTVILVITLLYYCIMPFFPSYAIIMWKDPLFSCALLHYSFICLEILQNRTADHAKKLYLKYGLVSLLVVFLRNNGIFIIAGISIIILFFNIIKHIPVRAFFICTICVLMLSFTVQGPLYNIMGIEKPRVESLGIPLQQLAYTAVYERDSLNNEEIDLLNNLLPIDEYKSVYAPCRVDNLKWNPDFCTDYLNNNTKYILQSWLEMLPRHSKSYIKSYLLETLGFWHPWLQNRYGYIDIYIADNQYNIINTDIIERLSGHSIQSYLKSFYPLLGSGTLFWIIVASFTLCIKRSKKIRCFFYLPAMFCWGTIMIATPVAFSLRYVYIFVLLLPLYITLPYLNNCRFSIKTRTR